ncbi:MAG: sigma-54-dependent transcriptional regulator [Vicinamibacterales bacterium]
MVTDATCDAPQIRAAGAVAVVDDDPAFAGYLRTFLTLRGYEPRTYGRGDELLAAIQRGAPPDVVLLDVSMPGLDGLQTLKALKAARPDLQVIMLSGGDKVGTIVEAIRAGAVDYVVKPDDPEGLGEIALDVAIKQAINHNQLVSEVSTLRRRLDDEESGAFSAWAASPKMRQLTTIIDRVADADITVLIRGESGVGKELVARALHQRSGRRSAPFVKVNCAALPADLLESELFGHEKGAFTGAALTRIGKFEQAHRGTIFLDEIGEMPAALQAKLLHVLQDASFTRLGSNKPINVDVRVVAATNRNLEDMMLRGTFREDLYYRLKVIEAQIPPLRERRDEIRGLTDYFIARYAHRYNRPVITPSISLREHLAAYHWPGNIRELENIVKRLVILQDEALITPVLSVPASPADAGPTALRADVEPEGPAPAAFSAEPGDDVWGSDMEEDGTDQEAATSDVPRSAGSQTLFDISKAATDAAERTAIGETLNAVHWNRRKAAVRLGVSYKTLLNKIRELGIAAPA